MTNFDDVIMAYGDSDEYSFLLRRKCTLFERRESKLVSTFASTFSSYYVALWGEYFKPRDERSESCDLEVDSRDQQASTDTLASKLDSITVDEPRDSQPSEDDSRDRTDETNTTIPLGKPSDARDPNKLVISMLPTFDARAVVYPTIQSVRDYFSWRQVDCHINNLYNTSFWTLVQQGNMTTQEAEKRLSKTVSADKHEMLFTEFGLNYNNEPDVFKKGTTIVKEFDTAGLSQRQVERKMKKMGKVRVMHCDIIRDQWWDERKWILE